MCKGHAYDVWNRVYVLALAVSMHLLCFTVRVYSSFSSNYELVVTSLVTEGVVVTKARDKP